jgi:glycosyltransferase involved in cell wall biosynthesis
MNENQIFFGYDVVDNGHFERGAKRAREGKKIFQEQKRLPENFFLVVSRFVEKKNLYNVILAYLDYYKKTNVTAWHLYVVGDGPLKKQLLDLVNQLHLEDFVHFEGFKQYDELPIYFGLAKAFVHASKTEQWGLVVNEAMASGLPVIISEPCGCVPELVHHGLNGYIIDPHNQNSLTKALLAISSDNLETERMGIESKKIIAAFDSDAFGTGLIQASKKAMHYKRSRGYITELILRVLIQR